MIRALSLPMFFIVLLFTMGALFGVQASIEQGGTFADMKKLVITALVYFLALWLVFIRYGALTGVFKKIIPLVLFYLYAFASILWSDFGQKVFVNFGHYLGTLAIAVCFAAALQKQRQSAEKAVLFALLISLSLSIAFVYISPAISIHPYTGRWQGLTGNPNTLGILGFVSIWFIAGHLYNQRRVVPTKLALLTLLASLIALVGCRSATSASVSLGILGLFFFFALIEKDAPSVRNVKLFCLFSLGVFAVLLLIIMKPELLSFEGFLKAIGKDPTLTGRTDLWEIAFQALETKLWQGWSFDSGLSVFNYLGFDEANQFHNGYIELFIRAGVIGTLIFFWILIDLLRAIKQQMKVHYRAATTSLVIIVAMLIHNVTEASFTRETHLLWLIFVIVYIHIKLLPAVKMPRTEATEQMARPVPAAKFNLV